MKRKFIFTLALAMAASVFTGCSVNSDKSDKLSVVCTTFPQYDWVREIAKDTDNIDITLLLDSGVDLHNYQPTADDIVTISECDMFIYVGGESDEWVDDALKKSTNKDMTSINMLEVLGDKAKEEEVVEGMEAEEEEHEGEEEGPEYDEHIWLSLKNAEIICDEISQELSQKDPENKSKYEENAESYTAKLNELDVRYQAAVDESSVKTLLFGDRFPFRYLADDYGLDYYAAFAGCSAETEASFETIVFLADKVDELGLKHIITIEGSDNKIAQTIIDNTADKNQDILQLDSIQSVTSQKVSDGVSYLEIMENNLEALKKALN